jgi:hypothetical protein
MSLNSYCGNYCTVEYTVLLPTLNTPVRIPDRTFYTQTDRGFRASKQLKLTKGHLKALFPHTFQITIWNLTIQHQGNINYAADKVVRHTVNKSRIGVSTVEDILCICVITPIPVTDTSKVRVCGRSLAGIAGSKPAGENECLSFVTFLCCHVEFSVTNQSLVERSPPDCGVSLCVCDLETSRIRRPWPALGCCTRAKNVVQPL